MSRGITFEREPRLKKRLRGVNLGMSYNAPKLDRLSWNVEGRAQVLSKTTAPMAGKLRMLPA